MRKKLLFIIPGVTLLLLALSIWVYLLIYGAPEEQSEVFTNLGFGNSSDTVVVPTVEETPVIEQDFTPPPPEALTQLTIRSAVGSTFFSSGSSTKIRYVERGTGHVYQINTDGTGEERLSNKTVLRTTNAAFSPDAQYIALIQEELFFSEAVILSLTDSDVEIFLPFNAKNITFGETSDTIRFTISDNLGTRGYEDDLITNERTLLFSLPLKEVGMHWESDEEFYVYTKPSELLDGALYRVIDGILQRTIRGGYGFTNLISPRYIISGKIEADTPIMSAYHFDTKETVRLPLSLIPEKCTFDGIDEHTLWCATPLNLPNMNYPDDWYIGSFVFEDLLWEVNIITQEAQLVADFVDLSGRQIDVTNIKTEDSLLLFTNRIDETLWAFNTLLSP